MLFSLLVVFCFCIVFGESFMTGDSLNSEEVYINLIEGRDDSNSKVLEFSHKDEMHSIKLTPGQLPVTPGFFVHVAYGPDKAHVYRPNIKEMSKQLYENAELQSSVRVRDHEGVSSVEGILTPKLGIRPNLKAKRSLDGAIPHFVYDIKDADRNAIHGVPSPARVAMDFDNHTWGDEQGRQSQCVNVEMLLVSDLQHQSDIGGNDDDVTWYCVVHANSGKLLYGTIPDPQIRLVVIGVVINKSPDAEPYVTNNLRENGKYVTDKALGDFTDYFNQNMQQDYQYDTAYLFTGRDFAFENNGEINGGLLGLAYVGTACTGARYGVGEDRPGGAFFIINILPHELGHNLGEPGCEDSPKPNSVRGMPRFGDCSIKEFTKFINSDTAQCLTVLGYIFYRYDAVAGERIDANSRCQVLNRDSSLTAQPVGEDCMLRCQYSDGSVQSTWDALDGRDCGNGNVCWMGECTQRGTVPWLCGE